LGRTRKCGGDGCLTNAQKIVGRTVASPEVACRKTVGSRRTFQSRFRGARRRRQTGVGLKFARKGAFQ
jgi:hypothetical protein